MCDSDEPPDSRLSYCRVTADVSIRTKEVLLAASATDAADLHERAIELVASEFGVSVREVEILEVNELDGSGARGILPVRARIVPMRSVLHTALQDSTSARAKMIASTENIGVQSVIIESDWSC